MASLASKAKGTCALCSEPASNRCKDCKSVWYCSREHQVQDWKGHKRTCRAIKADQERADSHTLHKAEFDRIRTKYGLDKADKAEEIADMLTKSSTGEGGVSAPAFAKKFGMSTEEAVVFLEWIQVGVRFKEETLDVAKKSGLAGAKPAGGGTR